MVIGRNRRSRNGVNEAVNPGSYRTRCSFRARSCGLQQQLRQHPEFVANARADFSIRDLDTLTDLDVRLT